MFRLQYWTITTHASYLFPANTAKVLSATLGFLAIHQDEQEKAYQAVISISAGREPVRKHQSCLTLANLFGQVIEDAANFPHLLACFPEVVRIYRKHFFLVDVASSDS